MLGIVAVGSASASADPPALPLYNGAMTFPSIGDPSGPEEFSWEVSLSDNQELLLIDKQRAAVYYTTESHHVAFNIPVEPAHDATGSAVSTSLKVSGGNVITLTVHHRAGNPATGAPFVYPVIAGEGWEGGFVTHWVEMPPPESRPEEAVTSASKSCIVPKLRGRSLKDSKRLLRQAECGIGKVRKLRGVTARSGKVVGQSPKPGMPLAPGTTVRVTLGESG